MFVSANDGTERTVYRGLPVVVEAHVFLSPDAKSPLTLSGTTGKWADALRLECTGPDGRDRAAIFTPAFPSNPSIELIRERSGTMVWILDGAADGYPAEGAWRIRVILDEKKLAGPMPVGLRSNAVFLTVAKAPVNPTPGDQRQKCLATMTAAMWKDDSAKALDAAAGHLAANPEDIAVLFMKGQVLHSLGKDADALVAFKAALAAANLHAPQSENFALERAVAEIQRLPAGH